MRLILDVVRAAVMMRIVVWNDIAPVVVAKVSAMMVLGNGWSGGHQHDDAADDRAGKSSEDGH